MGSCWRPVLALLAGLALALPGCTGTPGGTQDGGGPRTGAGPDGLVAIPVHLAFDWSEVCAGEACVLESGGGDPPWTHTLDGALVGIDLNITGDMAPGSGPLRIAIDVGTDGCDDGSEATCTPGFTGQGLTWHEAAALPARWLEQDFRSDSAPMPDLQLWVGSSQSQPAPPPTDVRNGHIDGVLWVQRAA